MRKKRLFSLADQMKKNGINFILIQIDEAHSTSWPKGVPNTPAPQKNFVDRVERANKFVNEENPPFEVLIDSWENEFANKYKAWPDQYYCINSKKKIIEKCRFGLKGDAIINKDCCDLIEEMLKHLAS